MSNILKISTNNVNLTVEEDSISNLQSVEEVTSFIVSNVGERGEKGEQGIQGEKGDPGATELSGLTDVDLSTPPTDGQTLIYDGDNSVFKAGTPNSSGDVSGPDSSTDSGIALFDGTGGKTMKDSGETIASVRSIPQVIKSSDYTLVSSDAGRHLLHPSSDNNARSFILPANSSVAFPIGTAITFVNLSIHNIFIKVNSDTLYLAGSGNVGDRTLTQYGVATAIKITSTSWIISGVGLT